MNIKIVTFHFTRNYGATLQAYALNAYLKSFGHNVEVIDYVPNKISKEYSLLNLNGGIGGWLKSIIKLPFLVVRNFMFHSFFRKNVNLTKERFYTLNDLKDSDLKADAFIVGSDQVWNSDITGGIDPVYYLDFVISGLKISYAASFGKSSVTESDLVCAAKYLEHFSSISVREESAINYLRNYINVRNISHVLDPVFLLEKEHYLALFNNVDNLQDYLFVYDVYENSKIFHVAKEIAEKKSLKITAIARAHTPRSDVDKLIYFCGPGTFLKLISNAKYVVTNSFHGTCLSIIMNKDFNVVPNDSLNERMIDILEKTKLKNRLVTDDQNIISSQIDYDPVNLIVQSEKMKSRKFLQDAINGKVGK